MTSYASIGVAFLVSVVACSSSRSGGSSPTPSFGDASRDGAVESGGGARDARADHASVSVDATTVADADANGEASAPIVDAGGAGVCPSGVTWDTGTLLTVSTGQDTFGAITPDELTLVWTTGGDGGPTSVYYVDRAAATTAFVNPLPLPLAADSFRVGPLAVSPDGLRVVAQATDTSFFALTRGARGSAFNSVPSTTEFADVNSDLTMGETVVELGDPVVGQKDQTFYYSRYPVTASVGLPTVVESSRVGSAPWADGVSVDGTSLLEVAGGRRRRPTGVSSDDLTLFYWDQVSGMEMMVWRSTLSGAFANATSIGARAGAQPNAACTALYYSAASAAGTSLYVAHRLN